MASGMSSDTRLSAGESLTSENGQYRLDMQSDGNLVLYRSDGNAPLWASQTAGGGGTHAVMQDDGNLVIYGGSGAVWASDTAGNSGAALRVQDDGNVVIYQSGSPLWATDTAGPSASAAGSVVGSGLERVYITKEGDRLEDVAAFFYGSPEHHQRLRDDNPSVAGWSGPLPAGTRLNVSEDTSRGDAVSGSA